jgi:nicotinamidase-related amidase
MTKTSILSVDLQNDFLDVRHEGMGRLEKALCLPGARRLIQFGRAREHQIVHVMTVHATASSLPIHLIRGDQQPYCLEGTEGAQIVEGLYEGGDSMVRKTQFSGFFDTDLAAQLASCDSVFLCGIATDCCILTTAFDAASHRKHVYVPYQAVSAANLDAYIFGLQSIAKSVGAIIDLDVLLKDPGRAWEERLRSEKIRSVAGGWYAAQAERLAGFRKQPMPATDLPASPGELIARLEAFLAVGVPT